MQSPTEPTPPKPPEARQGWLIAGVVVALLLGGAIALALRSRSSAEAGLHRATLESSSVPVSVIYPSPVAPADEITLPGSAQALQSTSIYARTSGYLKSWSVDIGTRVKQGQVLAEIETPEVDRQLEQAHAAFQNAQANLDLAQLTATRSVDLFQRKTISQQEKDQTSSDLAAKRALVDAAHANVRRLEQMQSFQKIVAPFEGVITARTTDVGALIQTGDSSNGAELFHLADNKTLRVFFSIPEVYASSIKPGAEVPITFDAFPGEKFTGHVVRDAASIDPRSHTLMTEADVENPTGRLLPGGYATVHLKLPARAGAVTLPADTLLFRGEGMRVAVVRSGRIVLVPIEIGQDHGNTLEVLGGLTPKDAVVIDPSDSLAEGTEVTIESPAAPKDSPATK